MYEFSSMLLVTMRAIKTLFVLLTVGSLQFTVCTGGVISALFVLMGNASVSTTETVQMSSAMFEPLLCATATEITTVSTEHIVATTIATTNRPSACTKGDTCLHTGGIATEKRYIHTQVPVAVLHAVVNNILPIYKQSLVDYKTTLAFVPHLKHTAVQQE